MLRRLGPTDSTQQLEYDGEGKQGNGREERCGVFRGGHDGQILSCRRSPTGESYMSMDLSRWISLYPGGCNSLPKSFI